MKNGLVVDKFGTKYWFKDGKLHREDGPAIETAKGSACWWFHGRAVGYDAEGFWDLWDKLTDEQRGNPTLLRWLPH